MLNPIGYYSTWTTNFKRILNFRCYKEWNGWWRSYWNWKPRFWGRREKRVWRSKERQWRCCSGRRRESKWDCGRGRTNIIRTTRSHVRPSWRHFITFWW
jgi:hypothetical protein